MLAVHSRLIRAEVAVAGVPVAGDTPARITLASAAQVLPGLPLS